METKKATVTKVVHNIRQWQSQYGIMYNHEVSFNNGDKGIYSSKSDTCTKFKEGQEADYSIETKKNGEYTNVVIKPVEAPGGFKGQPKNEKSIAAQCCLKAACELNAQTGASMDNVIKEAEIAYNWVISKAGL